MIGTSNVFDFAVKDLQVLALPVRNNVRPRWMSFAAVADSHENRQPGHQFGFGFEDVQFLALKEFADAADEIADKRVPQIAGIIALEVAVAPCTHFVSLSQNLIQSQPLTTSP